MRQLLVLWNDDTYQVLRASAGAAIPFMQPGDLATLPAGTSIVAGKRHGWLRRGPARIGYVVLAGRVIGTVAIDAADIERGWLAVG